MSPSTSAITFEHLRTHLEGAELELPLLPDAATQVVSACFDEDCDVKRIAGMVEHDPSLAGNVLHIANSALYGAREPIVTLSQAIARLGLRTLCDITLSVALQGRVFTGGKRADAVRKLWEHSSMAALWSREISRMRRRNVESAFLIGLLHDVGKPVVIEQADRLAAECGTEIADEDLFQWTDQLHAQDGARMPATWELPQWAEQSARWHHEPEKAESFNEEVATACLADLVAHWSLEGDEEHGEELCSHPVLADLGFYADQLQELYSKRDDVLESVKAFL